MMVDELRSRRMSRVQVGMTKVAMQPNGIWPTRGSDGTRSHVIHDRRPTTNTTRRRISIINQTSLTISRLLSNQSVRWPQRVSSTPCLNAAYVSSGLRVWCVALVAQPGWSCSSIRSLQAVTQGHLARLSCCIVQCAQSRHSFWWQKQRNHPLCHAVLADTCFLKSRQLSLANVGSITGTRHIRVECLPYASSPLSGESATLHLAQGASTAEESHNGDDAGDRQGLEQVPGAVVEEEDTLHGDNGTKEDAMRNRSSRKRFRQMGDVCTK